MFVKFDNSGMQKNLSITPREEYYEVQFNTETQFCMKDFETNIITVFPKQRNRTLKKEERKDDLIKNEIKKLDDYIIIEN